MDQLEELRRRDFPVTGDQERESISDIVCFPLTFKFGEYIKTSTNSEENSEENSFTRVFKFGDYEVEVKLDSEGRLLDIRGDLTPKPKKHYKELFCVDEEFPKRPLE